MRREPQQQKKREEEDTKPKRKSATKSERSNGSHPAVRTNYADFGTHHATPTFTRVAVKSDIAIEHWNQSKMTQ